MDSLADAAKLAVDADLVIAVVGLGNTEGEGKDRSTLLLPPGVGAPNGPNPPKPTPQPTCIACAAVCPAKNLTKCPAHCNTQCPRCPGCINPPPAAKVTQAALLKGVRAAMTRPGQKLVLVVVAAGPVALTNLDDYDAVLFAGLGGQSAGYGVADVMWGAVSPSARFP